MFRFCPRMRLLLLALLMGVLLMLGRAVGSETTAPATLSDLRAPIGNGVRISPIERRLLSEARSGEVDNGRLFRAALIASGVEDPADSYHYQAGFGRLVHELKSQSPQPAPGNAKHRAEVIYEFMHRQVLTGRYDINCTSLAELLDRGDFNCVSSTVLYNCLADAMGLPASAIAAPGHVLSILHLEDGPFEVETTCQNWFEIAADENLSRAQLAKIPGAGAARTSTQRRKIDAAQLLALVYYNHGVDDLEQNRFDRAVSNNYKALLLDPLNDTAQGNLLAAVNNWSLDLARQRDYQPALSLLEQGRDIAPKHETFATNYVILHQHWVEHLCRQGRYSQALAVLDHARSRHPEHVYLHQGRFDICRRWGAALVSRGQHQRAQAVFAGLKRRYGNPPELQAAEAAVFAEE